MIAIVVIIVFVVIVIVLYALTTSTSSENFQILGALADHQCDLARTLSDAEKQNPESRLMSPANLPGDRYAYQKYDKIIDYANNEICFHDALKTKESTNDYCERVCNGNKGCMTQCACLKEVANWCANMWCPSSKMPQGDCIAQCINKHAVNCTSGRSWNWKL